MRCGRSSNKINPENGTMSLVTNTAGKRKMYRYMFFVPKVMESSLFMMYIGAFLYSFNMPCSEIC